jgi:hypothetical protein
MNTLRFKHQLKSRPPTMLRSGRSLQTSIQK